MLPLYHRKILHEALSGRMGKSALEVVTRANLLQDAPANQRGHPEYHCDDSKIDLSEAYIQSLRNQILVSLREQKDLHQAWVSFGKLTHAAQDFYAHTNYIRIWVERIGTDLSLPSAGDIYLSDIRNDPTLISCRFYAPWEWITFIPGIGPWLGKFFPHDSHAYLNNDSPQNSPFFPQAYRAAVLRTVFEYNQINRMLNSEEDFQYFRGMPGSG